MTRKPSINHCHVLHKEVLQLPNSYEFLNNSHTKRDTKGKKNLCCVGMTGTQRLVPTYSASCRWWWFGYVITKHTHREHREAMAGGVMPGTPCAAIPRAIKRMINPSKAFMYTYTHIWAQRHGDSQKLSQENRAQPPTRAVPGKPSAPLPRCDAHQMSQLERVSGSPYSLREITAQENGTHYGMQRKTIWGLHKNYYRMSRV